MNVSFRTDIALIVMAAEADISMSVHVFEELTMTKATPNVLFSVKMRPGSNNLTGHPTRQTIDNASTSSLDRMSMLSKNH